MERKITFAPGEFYHIYNRGNNRQDIFRTSHDRDRFLQLLYLCNNNRPIVVRDISTSERFSHVRGDTLVDIGAYCLMPNHFHILLKEKSDTGTSAFMQKLQTGYSMYFNTLHERTGKLFEGVFHAEHVDDDGYLEYLYHYIHLNPVKLLDPQWKERGIRDVRATKKYLDQYNHSSYRDYFHKETRREGAILYKKAFPAYFDEKNTFEQCINEWLTFSSSQNNIIPHA